MRARYSTSGVQLYLFENNSPGRSLPRNLREPIFDSSPIKKVLTLRPSQFKVIIAIQKGQVAVCQLPRSFALSRFGFELNACLDAQVRLIAYQNGKLGVRLPTAATLTPLQAKGCYRCGDFAPTILN